MEKDWFTSWFDTPYYHLLYKNRDSNDAEFFINNLTHFLQLPKSSHILDLPCGKGRHSIYLNSLGYKVTGGDLSKNSISIAKKSENNTLNFEVWDMRKAYQHNYDAIFNLFTSFGYFSEDKDDILVLQNMKNGLKKNGFLVLDFLNIEKVKANLVTSEVKSINGIDFTIRRSSKNGFLQKNISFTDNNTDFNFTEKVKQINLEKFTDYFNQVGLKIVSVFGNYKLEPFDSKTSDRLILVAKC